MFNRDTMNIKIKRSSYKVSMRKWNKLFTTIYPTASRYEDGKLQAFSFMTEPKGR